jgi:3D (Asp-Asp-Asp) domain-containing protein
MENKLMPKKILSLGRRYFGAIRIAAIVFGFGLIIHITHRECSRNADLPIVRTQAKVQVQDSLVPKPQTKSSHQGTEVFHATAYCLKGLTYTGVETAPGLVAADPKIIPLGSMIYLDSPVMRGEYQVMDTGEAIKGKIIDIFIPSYEAAKNFGRRIVKVKVLRYGFNGKSAEKQPEK